MENGKNKKTDTGKEMTSRYVTKKCQRLKESKRIRCKCEKII